MIGKNRPMILLTTSFAAKEIHTAIQTKKLQRIPLINASLNGMEHLLAAVDNTDTAIPLLNSDG